MAADRSVWAASAAGNHPRLTANVAHSCTVKGDKLIDAIRISAVLLILGTLLTYTGFGIFPWRIYTERDTEQRLNLLAEWPQRWKLAQSFVVLGAMTSMAGSVFLVPLFSGSPGFMLAAIAAAGFVVGHVFWIWQLGLRIAQPQKFGRGELPAFLFFTYAILTLLALACFGAAFWLQGTHQVLGIGVVVSALVVLGLFLKFKDMPPFIFYAISLTIGLALLI